MFVCVALIDLINQNVECLTDQKNSNDIDKLV